MKKVFADTGYWIALLNPKDALYPKARQLTVTLKPRPIVTSEMVFTRKMGKSLALLERLPEQLNVLSAIFCDKLGE